MFKLLFAALTICALSFTSAIAASTDAEIFTSYKNGAKVSAMGVCDNMRNTVVHYTGADYKIKVLIPVTRKYLRFYVIVKKSGKEYFIKRARENTSIDTQQLMKRLNDDTVSRVADDKVVRKLIPMDWGTELLSHSPNFFIANFFPKRKHDCVIAPLGGKK